MDQFKEKLADSDPFKTWWPFIISIAVGLAVTIRLERKPVLSPPK